LKGNNYSDGKVEQPSTKRGGRRCGVLCVKEEETEDVEGVQNEKEHQI